MLVQSAFQEPIVLESTNAQKERRPAAVPIEFRSNRGVVSASGWPFLAQKGRRSLDNSEGRVQRRRGTSGCCKARIRRRDRIQTTRRKLHSPEIGQTGKRQVGSRLRR